MHEVEKECDRVAVSETLKSILALGFEIALPGETEPHQGFPDSSHRRGDENKAGGPAKAAPRSTAMTLSTDAELAGARPVV